MAAVRTAYDKLTTLCADFAETLSSSSPSSSQSTVDTVEPDAADAAAVYEILAQAGKELRQ